MTATFSAKPSGRSYTVTIKDANDLTIACFVSYSQAECVAFAARFGVTA